MKVHTRMIRQKLKNRPSGPCGCCPICGALPGHQNTFIDEVRDEVWQHKNSPIREKMAETKREPRPLTAREVEIVSYLSKGKSNKQIGSALGLSPLTIKSHLARITQVLDASDRAEIVAIAFRKGLIT